MQSVATLKRPVSAGRKLLTGLALALWAVTSLVAVSPQLHHWLHADAPGGHHDCVFTHVSKGELLVGAAGLVTLAVGFFFLRFVLHEEPRFVPATFYRWSPSRAPPPVFSSLPVVS